MPNQDTEKAWNYHLGTKHTYESIRNNTHFLDWANQPLAFKTYLDLPPISLPPAAERTGVPVLSALAGLSEVSKVEKLPNLKNLAHLLHFSAGITKRRRGEILFRAAACTGALYEIELYLVCGPLPNLPAGIYHFSPRDLALRRLREGDFSGVVIAAAAEEPSVLQAPVVVVSTGTYWRNAWKYQARTYRHFGWDNGTILANLLAVAAGLKLPARLVCGFVDEEVNALLGLEADREVSLSLVSVGHTEFQPPAPPSELLPLELKTVPLSRTEVDYPAMREIHVASSLPTAEEVAAWRGGSIDSVPPPPPAGDLLPLCPLDDGQRPQDALEDVILRRGSSRRFLREPISLGQLSTILERSTGGIDADFLAPSGATLNDLYLIVNAVEGLKPGAYFYRAGDRTLEALRYGDFRNRAAYLALEQSLAGDAAVAVFFLADLNRCLSRFGNRGYRTVQLEAGILGGKLYLAAYAHRLGATGLTFYDDDVIQFFSPHAAGKSAIFLVAIGQPARRPADA